VIAAVGKVYEWEIVKLLAQKRTYLGLISAILVPIVFVVVLVLQTGGPNDVPRRTARSSARRTKMGPCPKRCGP